MALTLRSQIAYALPALALAVVGIPIYVYVPKFYTDVVGIPVAWVGACVLGVRLFDAVTDPWIGRLSDRFETRWGRRRPWIMVGAPLLAGSLLLLLSPPADVGVTWFGLCLFVVFLSWTLVTVPYEALGAEIARDYHERTRLLSLRDGFLIVGTLLAAVSPVLVGAGLEGAEPAVRERVTFRRIALLYGPLLIGLCWLCAARVREIAAGERAGGGSFDLRALGRNRPFLILLASFTVSSLGSNLPATLVPFYVEYVLESEGVEVFLLLYFATGVVFLPLWVRLARSVGKKRAWLAAMAINTGAFFCVFFLGPGDVGPYAGLVILSGVGFGATLALPSAMQADAIDYDEWICGARREGQLLGIWSVARKLAAAAGVGGALALLGQSGYQSGIPQTPEVVERLRWLYALAPCLCNAVAFGIAAAYPLSRGRLADIQRDLETRRLQRV